MSCHHDASSKLVMAILIQQDIVICVILKVMDQLSCSSLHFLYILLINDILGSSDNVIIFHQHRPNVRFIKRCVLSKFWKVVCTIAKRWLTFLVIMVTWSWNLNWLSICTPRSLTTLQDVIVVLSVNCIFTKSVCLSQV